MKKLIERFIPTTLLTVGFALIVGYLIPMAIMDTGCSSTGLVAHKSEVVAIPAVNAAMEQWAIYVKAGKANQAQLNAVKGAYANYYAAEANAKLLETAWVTSKSAADQTAYVSAAADASTKAAGVVALVTTYMTVH